MTTIEERLQVHCPYVRAREYLRESLEPAAKSRLPERVRLTATLPATNIELAKYARVEYAHAIDPMHFDEPWKVHWTPENGGIYPSFEGELTVRADESYRNAVLELKGEYLPPAGTVGRAFDAAVGKTMAHETANNILAAIGRDMESRYTAEEAAKNAGGG
jgi:hypothetical protein